MTGKDPNWVVQPATRETAPEQPQTPVVITLGGKLPLGVVLAAELRRLRSALVPGLLDDGWDVRVGEELLEALEFVV